MNQYVVFALSRVTAADAVVEQRAAFDALRSRFPPDEAEAELQRLMSERSS